MGTVYRLTLRQVTGRWRLIVMAVLAALPVLVAAVLVSGPAAPTVREFESFALGAMLAGSITPLVVLAIAAVGFANEIEDRTLANLTLSPLPRWKIVVPKLLAALTVVMPFIGVSALLTARIAYFGDVTATVSVVTGALAAVVLYAAAFTWLGLVSTQAIGIGLAYIVLWEGLFAGFVGGVRIFSIRYYAIALMHGLDPRRFAWGRHTEFGPTVAIVALAAAGLVWLSVRRLRRMDVP